MFDGFDADRYVDEARARWGETDAFAESQRRTMAYGETEWCMIIGHGWCWDHSRRGDAQERPGLRRAD